MHNSEGVTAVNYYQRIKDLREDNNLSQEEVAQALGIKQTQYSRYELGKNAMHISRYIDLARYYNVSLDYLTGLIDVPRTIDGKPYKIHPPKHKISR